jgi:hypothetical protein
MNLLNKYRALTESTTTYDSGVGWVARVISKGGQHTAKFFKNGEYLSDADYSNKSPEDVHEFAQDEMEIRKKEHKKNESVIDERINEPQGHLESADHISDDSETGRGQKKKMMGNRTPLEIIAKILAGR